MRFNRFIDWIGVTLPYGKSPEDILPELEFKWIGKGLHGYKNRLQDNVCGVLAQSEPHDKRMGCHVQLSGSALSMLRSSFGMEDDILFRRIRAQNGRCSRIDCAIDIYSERELVTPFVDALKNGHITAKAKKWSEVLGQDEKFRGHTLYIGGRQSERMMRVYDKNAEQKIVSSEARTRLELEIKGIMAHNFTDATETNTVDSLIVGHIGDFVSLANTDFSVYLLGEAAEIEPVGRQDTNTERWLIEICAPALAKCEATNDEIVSKFMDAYMKAREAYK